jgi:hypothetical protein
MRSCLFVFVHVSWPKLFVKLLFGLYQLNVTSAIHEAKVDIHVLSSKMLII